MNMGTLHKVKRYPKASEPMAKDVLYIGIDLGTFRSVMVSSDSHEVEELTGHRNAERPHRTKLPQARRSLWTRGLEEPTRPEPLPTARASV